MLGLRGEALGLRPEFLGLLLFPDSCLFRGLNAGHGVFVGGVANQLLIFDGR